MAELSIQFEAIDKASPSIVKLSKAMTEAAKKGDRFASEIVNSSRRVDTALKKIPPSANKVKNSMGGLQKTSLDLKSALTGLVSAAAIGAFFKQAASAALEEEESLRRLAFAVNATGNSFSANKDKLIDFANAQQTLTRFGDTETFEVLGRILRVTGDVGQAMGGAALAQDIASASGKDLNFVTEQVAQLLAGETRALLILKKEFGAFVGDARTTQEALDGLQKGFGGAAASEQSFTKALAGSTNFLGDFTQKVGDGILPVLSFAAKAVAFLAKGFEQLGETIGFVAAQAFTGIQGAAKASIAFLKGNFDEAKRIAADTGEKSKVIAEEFAEGITAIEERFSSKRVSIAENETRLKSKQSTIEEDKAKKAAEGKQKAEEDFRKKVQEINNSVLALRGQSFEAELARIRTEQEAKIKALDDVFEKTSQTEDLINEKRKATVLIEEESARKIAEVRKKGLDDFNEKFKQSEVELLELSDKGFEAEQERIIAERDAKIEALDEAFEHTQHTAEQQFQLLEAQSNITAAAEKKIAKARKENLDEFEKGVEQVTAKLVDETSNAVTAMITEGKSFEDAWKSIMDSVLKTAIKTFTKIAIERAIAGRAGGGGFGGVGGAVGIGLGVAILPKVLKGIKFAEGGIVRRPTVGLVGEAGPEAVIPLNRPGAIGNNVQITINQSNNFNVSSANQDQVKQIMRRMSDVTRNGAAEGVELVKSILARQNRFTNESV